MHRDETKPRQLTLKIWQTAWESQRPTQEACTN
jgi:hypothetical protein